MITVHHHSPSVQIVALPERLARHEPEPFHPSLEDQAYELGYQLGRDGESAYYPLSSTPLSGRYHAGYAAGRNAREIVEARLLGQALGKLSGPSEPPGGYSAEEARAYREGYAEGVHDEWTEWVEAMEAESVRVEAMESDSESNEITDADVYPLGCVS